MSNRITKYIFPFILVLYGILMIKGVEIPRFSNNYDSGVFFIVIGILLVPIGLYFDFFYQEKDEDKF
ncbi:MAG: hypothetical protein ABXS91_09295 [Sulfurimonas sp.]